jgi:hypothetical protein
MHARVHGRRTTQRSAPRRQLPAWKQVCLREKVVHVAPDSRRAEIETACDLLVAQPRDGQRKDITFSGSQARAGDGIGIARWRYRSKSVLGQQGVNDYALRSRRDEQPAPGLRAGAMVSSIDVIGFFRELEGPKPEG